MQAHYQIFSIIFLKVFIKLNVTSDTMIKKCETCRIKYKYCDFILEDTKFKDDTKWNTNVCVVTKTNNTSLMQKLNERFFNIYKFSNHDNNSIILLLRITYYGRLGKIRNDWEHH